MATADENTHIKSLAKLVAQVPEHRGNLAARIGDRVAGVGSAGVGSVVDTTELRWFIEGQLPPDVKSWFTRAGTTGIVEERCDSYRMDDRREMGVKRRFRETLELKVRRSVGEGLVLDSGIAGRLEVWRKWSPAEGLIESDPQVPWVDVHKIVIKRRFSVNGDEIMITSNSRAMAGAGCDVEVTAVTVGGFKAWTFAFAAFGPTASRRSAIVASWHALVADTECPEHLRPSLGQSGGYPEWLARLRSLNQTAFRSTTVGIPGPCREAG